MYLYLATHAFGCNYTRCSFILLGACTYTKIQFHNYCRWRCI